MLNSLEDSGVSVEFLAIDTVLGDGAVILAALVGEEALSRCFLFEADIVVVTERAEAEVESLLCSRVTLWLLNNDPERRRPFNGYVRRLIGNGTDTRGNRLYRLEIVPRLWFLSCTSDCRIFQNKSVPEILRIMFEECGIMDVQFRVQNSYPALEYCVQHQETALAFVSRLMEHLGLFYWHAHSATKHVLVIADSNIGTDKCTPFTMSVARNNVFGELHSLNIDYAFRPSKWTLNDYDFESPSKQLVVDSLTLAEVPPMAMHEIYEYPGHFKDSDTGRQLTRLRIELEEAQLRRVLGTGNCPGFDPGYRFAVTQGGTDKIYLLTRVHHSAAWQGYGNSAAGPETAPRYENEFTAIHAESPYRPERVTPWPFVRGTQTATVVGPPGDQIYCDEYGRVRVHFHWDRRGKRNKDSSCWMRVAQSRSGAHYGTVAIPHVGHEVLVSFIEGDPDRPLITGTVPNSMNMPAVPLPGAKHKTVQRDHGDNKIVMHGKAGQEYLSMSSPRAVNLFASGKAARPLSSDATVPAPAAASGNLTFYSNPAAYTLSSVPDSSVQGQGTGTSCSIPPFQDGVGLKEVWAEWYGTTQSDIDNSSTISGAQGSYGTQDGTVADSYLNWGSEGRINCVALGNMNNWLYADANTWVNGDSNTQINGNVNTVIGGYANGASSSTCLSTTTIWGTANTRIFGGNVTTVLGDNTSTVVATNNAYNLGTNLTMNFVANLGLNLGLNISTNAASDFKIFEFAAESGELKLKNILTYFRTSEAEVKTTGVDVNNSELSIQN